MKNLKYAIILLVITSSCGIYNPKNYPSTKGYEKILETWLNSDINNLMVSWGPPANKFEMPNGNIMYTWLYIGNTYVSTNYNYYLNQVNSSANTYYCKTTFTTSGTGKVTNWRYQGNACKAKDPSQ